MQESTQGAGHITKAVIKWDRNTDFVGLKQRVINGSIRDGSSYFLIVAYPVADLMSIVD